MSKVRFRPPPIELTPALTWLLRTAFAAELPPALPTEHQTVAVQLGQRLDLAPTVGAKLRKAPHPIDLSDSVAQAFQTAHAHSAIQLALYERIARHIAGIAVQMETPIVFLKGFALFLCGRDRAGGRPVSDLDLLVPESKATRLHDELQRQGYRAETRVGNEHHLATLASPEGGKIDLHFCLRGLSLSGRSWATWEDLDERGSLLPVENYPANCTLPDEGVQTAHLLVHALVHHAWTPHQYHLLRLIGDLQELLPDEDAWQSFLDDFGAILRRSVPEPELAATQRLALELRDGLVPDLSSGRAADTALLLRHMLAGHLDENYGRRLSTRHAFGRLGDAARQGRLWHYLVRKVRRERVD